MLLEKHSNCVTQIQTLKGQLRYLRAFAAYMPMYKYILKWYISTYLYFPNQHFSVNCAYLCEFFAENQICRKTRHDHLFLNYVTIGRVSGAVWSVLTSLRCTIYPCWNMWQHLFCHFDSKHKIQKLDEYKTTSKICLFEVLGLNNKSHTQRGSLVRDCAGPTLCSVMIQICLFAFICCVKVKM